MSKNIHILFNNLCEFKKKHIGINIFFSNKKYSPGGWGSFSYHASKG